MAAIIIRDLSPETHQALKQLASAASLSTEAYVRGQLDKLAKPTEKVKLGSVLRSLGQQYKGVDLALEARSLHDVSYEKF